MGNLVSELRNNVIASLNGIDRHVYSTANSHPSLAEAIGRYADAIKDKEYDPTALYARGLSLQSAVDLMAHEADETKSENILLSLRKIIELHNLLIEEIRNEERGKRGNSNVSGIAEAIMEVRSISDDRVAIIKMGEKIEEVIVDRTESIIEEITVSSAESQKYSGAVMNEISILQNKIDDSSERQEYWAKSFLIFTRIVILLGIFSFAADIGVIETILSTVSVFVEGRSQ